MFDAKELKIRLENRMQFEDIETRKIYSLDKILEETNEIRLVSGNDSQTVSIADFWEVFRGI